MLIEIEEDDKLKKVACRDYPFDRSSASGEAIVIDARYMYNLSAVYKTTVPSYCIHIEVWE